MSDLILLTEAVLANLKREAKMAKPKPRRRKPRRRTKAKPAARSAVALTMAQRRRNAGPLRDKKREANKTACRKPED